MRGGGGVIIPSEIQELHDYGISKIFSPEDGRKMGLKAMIPISRSMIVITSTNPCNLPEGSNLNAG